MATGAISVTLRAKGGLRETLCALGNGYLLMWTARLLSSGDDVD